MRAQTFTCTSCGRQQVAEPRDLRRHPRYPRDCYVALCRWRDCNAEVAVAVEDGRLVQWGARTDRSRPGKVTVAPRSEAAAWGDRRQPTHTPMAPDEHEKTRTGAPRKDWRPV